MDATVLFVVFDSCCSVATAVDRRLAAVIVVAVVTGLIVGFMTIDALIGDAELVEVVGVVCYFNMLCLRLLYLSSPRS